MVEVAAASEVALGTLYQIFPSKEAMLCSLLEDYIDRLIERLRLAANDAGDAREQLRQVLHTLLVFSQQNADVLRF